MKSNIMKTKFKDILLYSLACIGAFSLLISATKNNDDIDDVVDALEDIESELRNINYSIGNGIYTYPQQ
jgi:hypothetical protein